MCISFHPNLPWLGLLAASNPRERVLCCLAVSPNKQRRKASKSHRLVTHIVSEAAWISWLKWNNKPMGSHTAYEVDTGFLGVWQTTIQFWRNVHFSNKKIIRCNSQQTYAFSHPFRHQILVNGCLNTWSIQQIELTKLFGEAMAPKKKTYPPHSFKRSKSSRIISKCPHPQMVGFFIEKPYPNCQLWECN